MKVGQKVYNTLSNRSGVIVAGPYMADNAMFLVCDVRWDTPYGGRSTVQASLLMPDCRPMNTDSWDDIPVTCPDCGIQDSPAFGETGDGKGTRGADVSIKER
jgi:hypothetical protein